MLEVFYKVACGIDVHQKSITCCIVSGNSFTTKTRKEIRTFGTTTVQLRKAAKWMQENKVEVIAMESTGQYWIPVWNIFSSYFKASSMILANPASVKSLPGQKTDMKDSERLGTYARYGLVPSSYIPSEEVLILREMTRERKKYIKDLTGVKNRIHNVLQSANIKLTSYLTNIFGKTGRALLDLFINGENITLKRVEECMHRSVKAEPIELLEALDGKLSKERRKRLDRLFGDYDHLTSRIKELEKDIKNYIFENFPEEYEILLSVPGISENGAAVILGEIGPNVDAFPNSKHLASWIGVCPGMNESAGYNRSGRTTKGNKYAKQVFVSAGGLAARSNSIAFKSFKEKMIKNTGSVMKANVACGHKLVRIVYKLLKNKEFYDERKALGVAYSPSESLC